VSGERLSIGFLDLVALVFLLFFSIRGWFKGIAKEICAIMGLFMGLGASLKYSSAFSSLVAKTFPSISPLSKFIAFGLIFLGVLIFFSLLGGFLSKFFKALWLGWFDKGGGFVFGLAEGVFLLSLLFWGIHLLPDSPIINDLKGESIAYKAFENYALPYLKEMMGKLRWR